MASALVLGCTAETVAQSYRTGADAACAVGSAHADLDVGNVRARLFNTGGLFYRSGDQEHAYEVPKGSGLQSVFASAIWVGGKVDGEVRLAGTTYGPYEFWPGPLGDDGRPLCEGAAAEDAERYDRIYRVSRADVDRYEKTGEMAADLRDWPHDLGAPVLDGDGDPANYNLEGGDRPEPLGDQMAWWTMNDAGGAHGFTGTAPIDLEVQVTAFAYHTADVLDDVTFYRYNLVYKGDVPLEDAYVGLFADPDLGDASDDYVGSDTTLGLGFVYNGDGHDAGGYGDRPPAVGYQLLQGPVVERGGKPDTLGLTRFLYYTNADAVTGRPRRGTTDLYRYLSGLWRDGTPWTVGGDGYGGSEPTSFLFPGDPVERRHWSEENADGQGSRNTPGDRRFVMVTGPFSMQPGDEQEVSFVILWARGGNRLGSVEQLRQAGRRLRGGQSLAARPVTKAPQPTTPDDEEQPPKPTLRWSRLSRAATYRVEVFRDQAMTDVAATLTTPGTSAETALGAGTYYWRVRGENETYLGAWSPAQRLLVGTSTAVVPDGAELPAAYRLEPNYPNPFNPVTQIRFGLPVASDVRVAVYDVLGREVATLADGVMPAGWHEVRWDADRLASGLYVCRLETTDVRHVRKMLLVK